MVPMTTVAAPFTELNQVPYTAEFGITIVNALSAGKKHGKDHPIVNDFQNVSIQCHLKVIYLMTGSRRLLNF